MDSVFYPSWLLYFDVKEDFPTIERLNAFDVILGQWVAGSVRVDRVHQSARIRGVGHSKGVA